MGMLAPPTDDLIERVKSNAILRWRLEGLKGDIVDYAIAIALEEAAKVVRIALEEHGDPLAYEAADRAIRELIEVCP